MNMNMLSAMGISPETQLLAAQIASAGGFGMNVNGMGGMNPAAAAWLLQAQQGQAGSPHSAGLGRMRPPNSAHSGRSPGLKSASSVGSRGLDSGSGMSGGGTPKNEEDVDPALLTDIPAWLRSLRLHKYTPNFEGMRWEDMVMLDDAGLEAQGVAALGARRKMLKTFEIVRRKMGMDEGGTTPTLKSA